MNLHGRSRARRGGGDTRRSIEATKYTNQVGRIRRACAPRRVLAHAQGCKKKQRIRGGLHTSRFYFRDIPRVLRWAADRVPIERASNPAGSITTLKSINPNRRLGPLQPSQKGPRVPGSILCVERPPIARSTSCLQFPSFGKTPGPQIDRNRARSTHMSIQTRPNRSINPPFQSNRIDASLASTGASRGKLGRAVSGRRLGYHKRGLVGDNCNRPAWIVWAAAAAGRG